MKEIQGKIKERKLRCQMKPIINKILQDQFISYVEAER